MPEQSMATMLKYVDTAIEAGLWEINQRIHVGIAFREAHPGVMRRLGGLLDGYSFDEVDLPVVLAFINDPEVRAAAKAKGKVGQKPKPPKLELMIAGKSHLVSHKTLPLIQALIDDLSKMECNT
jgi:hypothetical protein